jgi:hypothetical protein
MWIFQERHKGRKSKTLKNLKSKKIPLCEVPLATVKITLHALKWIALIIVLYLTIGFIIMLIQDGMRSIWGVVIYGIMGFVTFFMGYIFWMLAYDVIKIVNGRKIRHESPDL